MKRRINSSKIKKKNGYFNEINCMIDNLILVYLKSGSEKKKKALVLKQI